MFIGGVPSGANEETTKKTLEKFGVKIQKVELKYDKSNNKMRGTDTHSLIPYNQTYWRLFYFGGLVV